MSENAPNLLVVDWDFFFRNPSYAADLGVEEGDLMLYLWDHAESPVYTFGPIATQVWAERASGFLKSDMPLPMATNWENFWSRFRFDEYDVPVYYADSNLWAGKIMPSSLGWDLEDQGLRDAWATVSLYDAHHDCGYKNTGSFEEWQAKDRISCEDWMLAHHEQGSRLEVTYPAWRKEIGQVEPEPLVPVKRRVDDGTTEDRVYHAVFVCRSGAWVPPWCDGQFTEFLHAGPNMHPTRMMDELWEHPRADVLGQARQDLEARKRVEARIAGLKAAGLPNGEAR
ncbi:hypothetical protein ACFPC0_11050 [Streptomyces andamanensis]|uniref:Uncharacterized protein n=1 Tax=Streptomyces andamanensis TaxID=1565035 RepID=A0ABV8TCM2_9ACTN